MKKRYCKGVDICFKDSSVVSFKPTDTVKFYTVIQTNNSIGVCAENEQYPFWFITKTEFRNNQYFNTKQLS